MSLPHLTSLYDLYLTESKPFRKVHRMVDLFESVIKSTRKEATEIGTKIQAISPYRGRCADIRHRSISYQH